MSDYENAIIRSIPEPAELVSLAVRIRRMPMFRIPTFMLEPPCMQTTEKSTPVAMWRTLLTVQPFVLREPQLLRQ